MGSNCSNQSMGFNPGFLDRGISRNRVWTMIPQPIPAFWPCANKVVICLLFQARRPECHGVRPHSLKVATICDLMTEVIKGQSNFHQLAIQENYRDVAARDMAKVYSRNLAHRQSPASRLARGILREIGTPILSQLTPPESSEECQAGENICAPNY